MNTLTLICCALCATASQVSPAPEMRPNILWITSEDNSPYLGCYGDEQALTPNLDRLAQQGLRYRNAFANSPVCSAARTTLITGMYATTLGVHNHRSSVRIPPTFRLYPEHLRDAGYYCTNNSKTDYNLAQGGKPWDESSTTAHYKNRKPGQPFFAVFNVTTSHEGQLTEQAVAGKRRRGQIPETPRISPEQVRLPPYHADTPIVRRDWSIYYDNITLMDQEVGQLLAELDDSGLADSTIVFYYSDHGGALPRGKRNIHDSGTRVPLIVRLPQAFAAWAPGPAGAWVEQPVSFVDFPATLFSLTGVALPEHYQGRAFLGPQAAPPREHVYLYRGRMDERYDTVRAIRDTQYRYVRNFSPHRPWGQHYSYPFEVMPSMTSWYEAFLAGECNPVQARYWQAKPPEELYDLAADPYEVTNLADDPAHAARLATMRQTLRAEAIGTRDAGFIPEAMFQQLAGDRTIYDYAQSDAYPIERIVALAEQATSRDPALLPQLVQAMQDGHPVVRYWGTLGCLVLGKQSAPAREALRSLVLDPSVDVRVTAAEALAYLGDGELALETVARSLESEDELELLAALNALDFMIAAGNVPLARGQELLAGREFMETPARIARYLLSQGAGR